MKRTDKRLQLIIDQAISDSFKDEKVETVKINHFVNYFKSIKSKVLAIELLELYLKALKLKLNDGAVRIQSAVALSEKQTTAIEDFIRLHHIIYNTKVEIKPELIGGMKIQIGDQVYENTISQQINQIGEIIHG